MRPILSEPPPLGPRHLASDPQLLAVPLWAGGGWQAGKGQSLLGTWLLETSEEASQGDTGAAGSRGLSRRGLRVGVAEEVWWGGEVWTGNIWCSNLHAREMQTPRPRILHWENSLVSFETCWKRVVQVGVKVARTPNGSWGGVGSLRNGWGDSGPQSSRSGDAELGVRAGKPSQCLPSLLSVEGTP